jgi:hypothetical protein
MPRLYMLTVPGLKVTTDWTSVHDRLLDDFPDVIDVLATTMPATLLIAYEGDANVDAWLGGISDGIRSRRAHVGHPRRTQTQTRGRKHQRTWGLRREHNRVVTLAQVHLPLAEANPNELNHHPQSGRERHEQIRSFVRPCH